jgi:AhpD family alkylhydroperoxidase
MLTDKNRELISIGASLAASCQPCANFHLRAARIAGASEAEISHAVNDALSVSRRAAEGMAQLAAEHLGTPVSDAGNQENPLIRELVSISAACAMNSVPDFETHLAAAKELGATKGQILSAIKIADAVKGMAERKVEESTRHSVGTRPVQREACCPTPDDWLAEANPSEEKERTRMGDCGPQCECHSRDKGKRS